MGGPDAKRRYGRPFLVLKNLIVDDVGLQNNGLLFAKLNRDVWKDMVSPRRIG